MTDGKVITVYIIFVILWAIVPGLALQHSIGWIGFAAGGAIGIIWWIISGISGDKIILKTLGVESLNVAKYSEVAKLVTSKGIGAKMSPPSLWMVRNMSPMMLSVGLSPKDSHLVFTQGFFDRLDDKAQIGLIIRSLEEIRDGVTSANTGFATLLWFILLPGRLGTIALGSKPGDPNILATLLNLVPAFLIGYPLALIGTDKKKAYTVDSAAMRKLSQENPDYLAYGLMKLQEAVLAAPFDCDISVSGLCVINPNSRDPYQGLFKLHPPTPKRIDRLRVKANSSRGKINN